MIPQYLKLQKKIECGAQFIINQIGFDSRKISELRCYMNAHGMGDTPAHRQRLPVEPARRRDFSRRQDSRRRGQRCALGALPRTQAQSPDRGKAFFLEFAAKQIAIYRGLGFRGVYLGGVHNYPAIERILEIERTFAPGDWKQFAREIRFSRPGEFFYFTEDPATGLANPREESPRSRVSSRHVTAVYRLSKLVA